MNKDDLIIDAVKLLLNAIAIKILDELSEEANHSFDALSDKFKRKSSNSKDIF